MKNICWPKRRDDDDATTYGASATGKYACMVTTDSDNNDDAMINIEGQYPETTIRLGVGAIIDWTSYCSGTITWANGQPGWIGFSAQSKIANFVEGVDVPQVPLLRTLDPLPRGTKIRVFP